MWECLFTAPHPQTPATPPPLSPFLPLSLEGTERAFYCSTSPPRFFFFFSRKHPKNLISIQHTSPAHCIQSRALTIQSACLYVCVCASLCVCDGRRQAETGRENPFVFLVSPQGHVQALMNRRETRAKRAWGEPELIFHAVMWFRDFEILRSNAPKAPPTCLWLPRCVWPDLSPFSPPAEWTTLASKRDGRSLNLDEPHIIGEVIRKGSLLRGDTRCASRSSATSRFLGEIAVMFDTQFPWQPAILVYLTYICAVCTQTGADHLLPSLRTEAGDGFEWLVNDCISDAFTASVNRPISCVNNGWKSQWDQLDFCVCSCHICIPSSFFFNTIFKFDFLMPLIALVYNRIHKHMS